MSALNDGEEFRRFLCIYRPAYSVLTALTLSSTFFAIVIRCAELMKLRRIRSESVLVVLRGVSGFEAVLVDLQRPDLRFQCGAWHTESGSRAEGSGHPSSAFTQRSLNDCFFLRRKLRE